jgi:Putative restriction endonuclease
MARREYGLGIDTLAEVMERLGGIPLHRVRVNPPIGTATEKDLIAARDPLAKSLELVDGALVEKAVTTAGSVLAAYLAFRLGEHVKERNEGVILGAACPFLLKPGLVRKPSVAFVPWEAIPGRKIDMNEYFARFAPALVGELIVEDTTPQEMDRRIKEYFAAGTRLAWVIDLRKQTAKAYASPETFKRITRTGSLDGAPVLPGFKLSLPDLFASLRPRKRTG